VQVGFFAERSYNLIKLEVQNIVDLTIKLQSKINQSIKTCQ
jgi:hypothetical protein